MSKQEFIKTQSCVLRVNIQCDCDGCRNKVKKLLLKVDGVYTVSIDSKQGKVTVTGNVDPAVLIRKLEKSGKRAELWTQKKKNHQFNLGNKFKNTQIDSSVKSQKSAAKNNHQQTNAHIQQILQQMRGAKEQKSVKFNLHNTHGDGQGCCDDDFDEGDDSDDEDYDEEDEDGYDDDSDEEYEDDDHDLNDLFGHSQHAHTKTTTQTIGNNGHKNKGNGNKGQQQQQEAGKQKKLGSSGGGGKAKKGGGFHLPAIIKSIAHNAGCKKINVAKRVGGRGVANGKKGNHSHAGGGGGGAKGGKVAKNGNGSGNGGGGAGGAGNNKGGGGNSGKNEKKNRNGKKKNGGGPKGEGIHDMNVLPLSVKGNGNVGEMGPMGQMGQLGQVGNYPIGPLGPQATGAMNGKYYNQGVGTIPLGNNPYANQQYMAMLMNQQRMMMNAEAMQQQQAMYGRPPIPSGFGYLPPPPAYDPLTHMFSDENTGSCSIM